MNILFENPDKVNGLMTVTVEEADFKDDVEKTLKDYRKKANFPGFRPGMVPMGLIKKQFGASVKMDTLNKFVGEKIYTYIKDNKIQMLGEPLPSEKQEPVDIEKDGPYTFMFDIAVAPEFKIELNGDTKLAYYNIKADDKLIDQQVDMFASQLGSYEKADSYDGEQRDMLKGDLRELDADGKFARVAGCPPDYFSAEGQLWGNPLYDWAYHRETGFAWWIKRVRHALGIYDLIRIDHFRGFDTYWAIPATSPTARTGKWEIGPRMELFHALESALGQLPIIAEDLGELTPSVRELLAESGFPGMKVLQFAFSGGDSEYLPHNHIQNCVVYPGTHDNTTLADWWENGAAPKEKQAVAAYFHLAAPKATPKQIAALDPDEVRLALLRAALGSTAARAIIPMYDWLGLGAEAHLNTPGKLGGNWAWRAEEGFDAPALARTIRQECEVYWRKPAQVSAD